MEKHRLHGRIEASPQPPDPRILRRLARHETAKIADAMGGQGAAQHDIKPLRPEMRLCGPARTVLTRPGDALYVQAAIDGTRPGEIIVIDALGYKDVAVIGERLAAFFRARGAGGIVVDGAVRDSIGILAEGIPAFARACCIRIFGSVGPGAVNVPVSCGGVAVNPGDIVCGDADGIVIVPQEDAARVADLADEHLKQELLRKQAVESGRSVNEVFGLEPKLARWRDA